jgi:hypothetical protein
MVHLVHAGVQAGSTRAARCRLRVVTTKVDPVTGQLVQMGGAHHRMTHRGQSVASELVQGDEQNVGPMHDHSLPRAFTRGRVDR